LISAVVRSFAGGTKSDAASAIGFARLASSESCCKRFSDATNYRLASMVIEYQKRVLIILVSIRLHRI